METVSQGVTSEGGNGVQDPGVHAHRHHGVAGLFVPAAHPALAQEATPATGDVEAPAVIAEYLAALNSHDSDRVAALYAENAVVAQAVQDGNTFRGRDEIRGWIESNLQGIPDLTVTTESAITESDRIAWAWVYRGAYSGQYPGLPAGRGQPIEPRGVSLLELENGEIIRETVYFDNYAFLTQVGALATPEAASTAETGAVTVRVYACPADLSGAAGQDQVAQSDLIAACTAFDSPDVAPTLSALPDGEPMPGTIGAPGVYSWSDLSLGDYAELDYFYFLAAGTPEAGTSG